MKTLKFIFFAFIAISIQTVSVNAKSLKVQDTEDREVSNFHAISSSGSFNVVVRLGSTEDLSIEGNQEDLERIETVVQNGILKIRLKRDINNWNQSIDNVNIYVTAKKLDGLIQSGSGEIELEGKLTSASTDIQLSGSGKIITGIDSQSVGIAISGSGNVEIFGNVGSANVSISGSGGLNGKNLNTDKAKIQIAGSGNAYINAKSKIDATLLGSGSIRYKGNPEIVTNKVGSGSIRKM